MERKGEQKYDLMRAPDRRRIPLSIKIHADVAPRINGTLWIWGPTPLHAGFSIKGFEALSVAA